MASEESLHFADRSVDLVSAVDLLEHVEYESTGLGEARRVLRDGGRVLLGVPAFGFLWSDFDRFSGHYHRYGKDKIRRKIEGSGFQVSRLSYFNTMLFPLVWGVRAYKNWAGRWRAFRSDPEMPFSGLNGVLARILSLEAGPIPAGDMPLGVSLVCLARKNPQKPGANEA